MDALQARIMGVLEAFQERPWVQAAIVFVSSVAAAYILTAIVFCGLLSSDIET